MPATPDPMVDVTLMDRPADARWPWPVHRTGTVSDPPVIVMHEIFGMSPVYLDLCRHLASAGFSVWMPQLVGRAPSVTRGDRARAIGAICISREIDVLRSGRTSRVVTPLRRLAQHLSETHDNGPVGVVGMCLTGGFALAMATEPGIAAAVTAQPALAFRPVCGRTLGISGDDVATVQGRLAAGEVEVYYTRIGRDVISPRGRLRRAVERLDGGDRLTVDELPGGMFRRLDHSVLTAAPEAYAGREPQATRLAETAARITAFLHDRLDRGAPQEG